VQLLSCIFCEIIAGKKEGHFVYDDGAHVAFLDKYPIDKGHCLIVPKTHYEKLIDMDSQNVANLFSKIPKIVRAIMSATGADAFSLAQNNGKAAKQIIPHVHIHIIPRYSDVGPIWTKRTIPTFDELEELAQKIRQNMQ
jgi:histidine triad (HIT) family protein